jgi:hypothetical protein
MRGTFFFSINEVSIDGPSQQLGWIFLLLPGDTRAWPNKLLFEASRWLCGVLATFPLLLLTLLYTYNLL